MTGFLALGALMLAGFALLSLMLAIVITAVKAVFWLVFLPFRLLAWTAGAVAMLVGLLVAPLLPLVIVGAMVYALVRILRRPATV
jgi:hypothetical protein